MDTEFIIVVDLIGKELQCFFRSLPFHTINTSLKTGVCVLISDYASTQGTDERRKMLIGMRVHTWLDFEEVLLASSDNVV